MELAAPNTVGIPFQGMPVRRREKIFVPFHIQNIRQFWKRFDFMVVIYKV
ncbi:MAG: hypothetical protein LBC51_11950 [Treponema sp.]|jgi:hypothetical protein|nr:hypothetical protein [Treponema sp.]